jgi:S1-C subfamily serine protease
MPQLQWNGMGAITRPDGFIMGLSNFNGRDIKEVIGSKHAIIEVLLGDKRMFTAELVGSDPGSGLAVLKVNATNLPYLKWGNCEGINIGDQVMIVDPESSRTGNVRAIGVELSIFGHEDFIEVAGSFESKDFHGLLMTPTGELVGINAAWHEQKQNTGYAISCRLAQPITEKLIQFGKVARSSTGVKVQPLTPELAATANIGPSDGIFVADIKEDGAAYEAGVRKGDIIVEVNGHSVKSVPAYRHMIWLIQPGTESTMKVIRNGTRVIVHLRPKEEQSR